MLGMLVLVQGAGLGLGKSFAFLPGSGAGRRAALWGFREVVHPGRFIVTVSLHMFLLVYDVETRPPPFLPSPFPFLASASFLSSA